MENIVARLKVSGTDVEVTEKKPVTAGMVGAAVRIEFDATWAGLGKTAVFEAGSVTRDVLIKGETVTIPHECLVKAGVTLNVGVYGTDGEQNLVIPTVYATIGWVNRGADPSGDESTDPSLPVWAQLREEIRNSGGGGTGGGGKIDPEAIKDAVDEYLVENPLAKGKDGEDGTSPTVEVASIDGGHRVTITDAEGAKEFDVLDGYTPQKGIDYGTPAELQEIAEQAAGLVEVPEGGGGEDVYELIESVTVEQAVSKWACNFKGKPMKKLWLYIYTPAHTVDTNYTSLCVSTAPGGEAHFCNKTPYIYAVPRKSAVTQEISMEIQNRNGEYALVFQNSINDNSHPLMALKTGRASYDGCDSYGNPLNGSITSVTLHTYQTFDVGAKIILRGVRA